MGSLHIMSLVIPSKSVLDHNAIPELTLLRKKSQSIAYHLVPDGCVQDEWRVPPM